jgi:hypothetical protein
LFSDDYAGFQVAIPVGLLVSAVFAAGSAFVDVRPEIAPLVIRHRKLPRIAVVIAMAAWFVWTVAKLPPLHTVRIRPCHSHQLACHLRSPVAATPISASDSNRKQAMTAAGSNVQRRWKMRQYLAALAP